MKILLLANSLDNVCGVTSHLKILASGLRNYGVDITLACGGGNAVNKFTGMGVRVEIIPELAHEKRSIKNYLTAKMKLFLMMRKYEYDIVHSHHHYCANLARGISDLLGIKSIQTVHGILPNIGRLPHLRGRYFIAVSDYIAEHLIADKNIPKKYITKIYNAGNPPNYTTIKRNEKIKFIAAARFVKGKNLEDYINAVNLLNSSYYEKAEFILAGVGEHKYELEKLNEEKGGKVKIVGPIDNLSSEIHKYDVFVNCSRKEGMPMSLIESALSGCMIITSSYIGINKYFNIINGAEIYKPGDYKQLKRIIEKLIDHSGLISAKAVKMFEAVKDVFSSSVMVSKTIQYYKSIMDGE